MASREELYSALRNADAAGDVEGARKLAAYIKSMPSETTAAPKQTSLLDDVKQGAGNLVAGAVRGAGSIGATLLWPIDKATDIIKGDRGPTVTGLVTGKQPLSRNEERRQAMDDGLRTLGAEPDSLVYKGGKLLGELAGTAGAGGAVARGAAVVAPRLAASPIGTKVVESIASNGFRTGAPAATTFAGKAADLGIRAAGGAAAGGAAAGLVNPNDAGTGAIVGGLMPPAISGIGAAGRYGANAARSLVQPFTEKGQNEIAQNVIRRFAQGGPTALNASEIVPGSVPTLAEATGNAGLATLQRGARDLRPNAFVEREGQNTAARSALFDKLAGDQAGIDAAKISRDDAAEALYGKAFAADAMRRDLAKSAKEARAPFVGAGLSGAGEDLATPGLRELAQRPQFRQATEDAKRLAANKGHNIKDPLQSLEGLHYVKLALDDMMNPAAATAMGRNASAAVGDMRNKLADEIAKVSPLYGNARQTYAEMSPQITAMETLQGLKLTDAQGNITLSKVQNAIRNLEADLNKKGISGAKALSKDQLKGLYSIRDDLLRQANLGLGKSAGSNTYQNFSTNNALNSFLGNTLTRLADKVGIGGIVGQAGKLAYSGPDEAIRNKLVDMMLEPKLAVPGLLDMAPAEAPGLLSSVLTDPRLQLPLYRSGPVLGSDR